MEPLVSIIMPNYNCEQYISESINSVIKQSYTNWQLIIIDDYSNDNSIDIINEFKDDRIIVIRNEENKGVSYSRNKGVEEAKGEYICFLDSDDIWYPNKLELQINYMTCNNYLFSCTGYANFYDKSKSIKSIFIPKKIISYDYLLCGNEIGCLTVMIKSNIMKKYIFEEKPHEDYILWLDILKNNINCYCLTEPLAFYRIRNDSISSNKLKSAMWTWNILYYQEKIGFLNSVKCFNKYIKKGIFKHYKGGINDKKE